MPVTPTYPGVYVEEIPSGVRTITGVATSITAFIGRTLKGPVNQVVPINSYADFERNFGGLWVESPLTYAVRDFYGNGGSQALIVRLYKEKAGQKRKASIEFKDLDKIKLESATEGVWGTTLRATIDPNVSDAAAEQYKAYGLTKSDLFNLTVRAGEQRETFVNVSFKEGPRRIDRVLVASSNLVRWGGAGLDVTDPSELPPIPATLIEDLLTVAEVTYSEAIKQIDEALQALYIELTTLLAAANPDNTKITEKQTQIADKVKEKIEPDKILSAAKAQYAGSDGEPLTQEDDFLGSPDKKTGLYALDAADLFNLLCIPPDAQGADTPSGVYQKALSYCVKRRAMLIVDPKFGWGKASVISKVQANQWLSNLSLSGVDARNAALYFPRIKETDPAQAGQLNTFVPCGVVAGIMARTDIQRGVWKAPAGTDAALNGAQGLQANLTNGENGDLNQLGINCLRDFPVIGRVVWGARTLRGADQLTDEYKYVPVRRTALFIEESLYRGLQWVVFEPNDEPLWAQIRLNVGAFMHNLFRQGAFQGTTPRDAYFVKCDKETTTQNDINLGIVNVVVGFAPLKPAEFVILKLQQMAGQIQT